MHLLERFGVVDGKWGSGNAVCGQAFLVFLNGSGVYQVGFGEENVLFFGCQGGVVCGQFTADKRPVADGVG